ncbi:MAG: copper resistance protein CopC/CopD, partial [Actinomycetota bacterium]|nr:copper resistance protein CopC/CopD [Actinomycetota bacterium]
MSTLLAGLVALCVAPAAFGHASFLGSAPQPGTRLQASPQRVVLSFTEPLNRQLTKVRLVRAKGGAGVAARVKAPSRRQVRLIASRKLRRGAYRVKWHSVSTEDGHALEGSFSFGVGAAAAGGGHAIEQSPLARGGAVRVATRLALYVTLLLFAGALLLAVILGRAGETWLVPRALEAIPGVDVAAIAARERSIVTDLGIFATAGAAAAALAQATDAAQGISAAGLRAFLLTNVAGLGRLAVIVLVLAALVLCRRRPWPAAALAALALLSVAVSGHASSASPRIPAILNDWVHLLAGSIWLGGIGLIVLVWRQTLRRGARPLRVAVTREVLPRFGRIALPAFAAVSASGVVSLLVQLGELNNLWQTAYGRVLLVKITLVALIALASWWHAMRLRPRLLRASDPAEHIERRHWRLLGTEPLLG